MLANNIQKTIDAIYPIGALYLSMNNTNPSTLFGGTWKQLTADAYLKIVTSGASETAKGQTNHKIPISSMPSHNHRVLTYTGHTRNSISNNYSPDSSSDNLGKYWGLVGNGSGNGPRTGYFANNGDDGTQQTTYSPACGYSNKARAGGAGNQYNTQEIIESRGGGKHTILDTLVSMFGIAPHKKPLQGGAIC